MIVVVHLFQELSLDACVQNLPLPWFQTVNHRGNGAKIAKKVRTRVNGCAALHITASSVPCDGKQNQFLVDKVRVRQLIRLVIQVSAGDKCLEPSFPLIRKFACKSQIDAIVARSAVVHKVDLQQRMHTVSK